MPFNIGPFELLLVLILALLVLGPGKLPEVGSALGRTIREFRKASTDVQEGMRLEPSAPSTAAPSQGVTASQSPTDQEKIRALETRLAELEKERQAERPASEG